ncbi:MAG TPA: bifunctional diaminohydroxyphosphoribosylaminopyrimidine deaminase/5-amino-6-(5-phosphoribosylamino)uracil reductase RibD [Polyangiaceae bacterium]|nr:bifunctional diaminohydroxyphosphoribosylaminopyrimidine deaminase/5-amino-6-(5-phosphoribosylamino)uracil reductase RibD [Polyangiaceae bacterium]
MTPAFDVELMGRALAIAKKGDPSPNPHVGCVIARGDGSRYEILSEAFHETAGKDHAEVAALRVLGDEARGATAYITLEPCNHHGKTPPCVDRLIEAGIARVVVGCRDPNPAVAGGGLERLREAGVEVELSSLEREAKELIEAWTKFITTGQAFLSLKLALSLDGRIASRTGISKWITGGESRAFSHELRARHDAVMVGINTVLTDDPRLTVRATLGRDPIRVIVDSKLRLPLDRKLVKTASETSTCVLTTSEADPRHVEALQQLGVSVIHVPATSEGRCDMRVALRELAKREVVSVLCEGGAELAGSMLAAQHADRLHAFIAPLLLGPRGRPGAVDWAGPEGITDAPRLVYPRWQLHGDDAYVTGRLSYPR